ncbi:MAG TPA: hypothetical protein DCX06_00160 [Opitutae bacterium]|nr:hypothetical protein [Opitutae bacterium]
MSSKPKVNAVGFPPPLMGEKPLRLCVLAETEDWVALDKPAGLLVREYPWDGKRPNLDAALNTQLQAGKPELVRRGATLFGSVYYLDPVISGPALFGKGRESLAKLRNAFGSGDCAFRFIFVTGPKPVDLEDAFKADAPLLPHNVKPKMIPSSAKGKKCSTEFRLLAESTHGWTVWEAGTTFFRPHQVRAHAAVHGLPVLSDGLYGGAEMPTLRDLQTRRRAGGLMTPAMDTIPLHLASCDLGDGMIVESPLPKAFQLFLNRLGVADDFQ